MRIIEDIAIDIFPFFATTTAFEVMRLNASRMIRMIDRAKYRLARKSSEEQIKSGRDAQRRRRI
jgi:hypothetical protein